MNPRLQKLLVCARPLCFVPVLIACVMIPAVLLRGGSHTTPPRPVIYWVIVEVEDPLSGIRGTLQDCADYPAENVRVELYDHSEVAFMDFAETQRAPKQTRVAVTKSRKRGEFKFGKVKPGLYEVRIDDPEWSKFLPTSLVITIAKAKGKQTKRSLKIRLSFEGMSCETLPDEPKKKQEEKDDPPAREAYWPKRSDFDFTTVRRAFRGPSVSTAQPSRRTA